MQKKRRNKVGGCLGSLIQIFATFFSHVRSHEHRGETEESWSECWKVEKICKKNPGELKRRRRRHWSALERWRNRQKHGELRKKGQRWGTALFSVGVTSMLFSWWGSTWVDTICLDTPLGWVVGLAVHWAASIHDLTGCANWVVTFSISTSMSGLLLSDEIVTQWVCVPDDFDPNSPP